MAAYYCSSVREFLGHDQKQVAAELSAHTDELNLNLRPATIVSWKRTTTILNRAFRKIVDHHPAAGDWGLLLEYDIPRRNRRIDCVILAGALIIVVEFKTGRSRKEWEARRQAEHYALELRDFHRESRNRILIPVVATSAGLPFNAPDELQIHELVSRVLIANERTLDEAISCAVSKTEGISQGAPIDVACWNRSAYEPVPNIIEAAQMLFANHSVREILDAHADVSDLTKTTDQLVAAISRARERQRKVICFVTGVPGAGKTLAGLNLIHNPRLTQEANAPAAFLSGNVPLVKVVSEALARDHRQRTGLPLRECRHKVGSTIQSVHSFQRAHRQGTTPCPEHIIVFDEAQRAWDARKVGDEQLQRATVEEREAFLNAPSEPEIMLNIMDRWTDWAAIVALVGGGQEIHDGEAGLAEWGATIRRAFRHWDIVASPEALYGGGSIAGSRLFAGDVTANETVTVEQYFHLGVCVRSLRALGVADWVNAVVGGRAADAARIAADTTGFPIRLTRSVESARNWLRLSTRGFYRCGLLASSGALRLRAHGIELSSGFRRAYSLKDWFLADPIDFRSSNMLEVALSEFECQGLELDRVGVCWGGDFVWDGADWDYRHLHGAHWRPQKAHVGREFTRNKYRVLLTRARQGLVIWVPEGDASDVTRDPVPMDRTARFLVDCGAQLLE
jgi:hypothetical protein